MVGVLVITHGNFGAELLKSAEMIVGKQENVSSVSFMPDESFDDLIGKVKNAAEKMNQCTDILVFVDIYGGSPFNSVVRLIDDYKFQCISGVNLPMIVEAFLNKDCMDSQQLKKRCLAECKESIKDINSMLNCT